LYVADALSSLPVRVSRIAAGVPHGGELEFTDQVTLGRALEERRAVR
ncbi:MAG: recombination protein RecR, partial [Myxococcales bacterium]|nr:recombination protein RecR [Myxococcales bacterium]